MGCLGRRGREWRVWRGLLGGRLRGREVFDEKDGLAGNCSFVICGGEGREFMIE